MQAFEYPGAEKLERYQQEYQILRQLDSVEGVIKAYDLKEEDKNIVIILEDFGALSLKEWFNQQERTISISKFLSLAKQLAVILSQIHLQKIIHQDINPANILLNPETEVDLIPELELIIGSQPPVPEMFADVSQNRLSYLLSQFIRACCSPQQPLVIFLDDLQWADPASLKLIQSMLTDPEGRSLLVIGGYEPKEIQPSHPLNQTLEELASAEIIFQSIFLAPLTTDTIARMIADTLHTDGELTQPSQLAAMKILSGIVLAAQIGNPPLFPSIIYTMAERTQELERKNKELETVLEKRKEAELALGFRSRNLPKPSVPVPTP